MDSLSPAGPAGRLSLALPSDWISLDMSADVSSSVQRLVDRLAQSSEPEQPDAARRRLKLRAAGGLRGALGKARERGAVTAAIWSMAMQGHTAGASVTAAITPFRAGAVRDSDGSVDLARAVDSVGGRAATDDGATTVVESSLVELPAGPAVRVHKTKLVDVMGGRHQTEVLQYYLLVPGLAALAVLTFSTPSLDLIEPLTELFEAIASTLRWRP